MTPLNSLWDRRSPATVTTGLQSDSRWTIKWSRPLIWWIRLFFLINHWLKKVDSDIVAGFSDVLSQGGVVKDFWASRYSAPDLDSKQDLLDESVRLENGYRIMTFKRKINTEDPKDVSFENEIHLIFPYTGGPMFGTDTMGKHKETPVVTDTKIRMNIVCEGK